jgi:hypothetical protein
LLPYTRGHIILYGNEQVTGAALEALAKRDREIVTITPTLDPVRRDALEGLGLTCAEGDPLLPDTFKWLNVQSAAALFLTHAEDLTNLNIAMGAMEHAKHRPPELEPLLLGVLLEDEGLAAELDAALDGIARGHNVRYHRLCPDRDGLRQELRRLAPVLLKPDLNQRSHVLVAGLGGRWEQMLAQVIIAAQDHPDLTPRITLLLDEAEQAGFDTWRAARPELPLVAEFTVLSPKPQAAPEGWEAPHLILVLRPDGDAVATALALRRPAHPLGTERVPVLVRQSREDHLLSRLAATEVQGRDMTGLVAFGGLLRAESLERVLDRAGEATAIAMHAAYQEATKTLPPGSPESIAEWDKLSENLREANRAAAEHAPILLAAVGLRAADVADDATIERMARIEHRRWIADRIDRGWRYALVRDNARLLHPSLCAYDALPETEQEKDRSQVRTILGLLAALGRCSPWLSLCLRPPFHRTRTVAWAASEARLRKDGSPWKPPLLLVSTSPRIAWMWRSIPVTSRASRSRAMPPGSMPWPRG